jgi:hypothetical protein
MTFRVADLMIEPMVAHQPGGGNPNKCHDNVSQKPCKHCTTGNTCQPCTRGQTGGPSTCTTDTAGACGDCGPGLDPWAKLNAAMQAKLEARVLFA